MKKSVLVYLLFTCFSMSIHAQFDKNKTFKPLKLENKEVIETKVPPAFPSINFDESIDLKKPDFQKKTSHFEKEEPTKSILEVNNEFRNPGDEIKEKLNKEISKNGNWEDVFFGKYIVNTPIIKIKTRDFMDPDGDQVRIILNNIVLFRVITLEANYKTFTIELREGDNLLDILALNQGLAGPNTANFVILDGNDKLITSNNWDLNTGVSAKFVIEYRKGL